MYFTGIQDADIDEMIIANYMVNNKIYFSTLDDVRNYIKYGTTDINKIQKKLGITKEIRDNILQKFKEEHLSDVKTINRRFKSDIQFE